MKLCKDCKHFRSYHETCENSDYVPMSFVDGKHRMTYASNVRMRPDECAPAGHGWVQKDSTVDRGAIMYIITVVIAVTIAVVTSLFGGNL
jgi:hypothetical protein